MNYLLVSVPFPVQWFKAVMLNNPELLWTNLYCQYSLSIGWFGSHQTCAENHNVKSHQIHVQLLSRQCSLHCKVVRSSSVWLNFPELVWANLIVSVPSILKWFRALNHLYINLTVFWDKGNHRSNPTSSYIRRYNSKLQPIDFRDWKKDLVMILICTVICFHSVMMVATMKQKPIPSSSNFTHFWYTEMSYYTMNSIKCTYTLL